MGKPLPGAPRRGHLELAVNYTKEAWFPALPGATERLVAVLSSPGGVNRQLLMNELKRDLSVISALSRCLVSSPQVARKDRSLLAIHSAPVETLRSLVTPELITKSKHRLDELQGWQSARMVETAIAVTAAQTLSSSYEVEADLAYTCALLRQLGLSLLAWNYPHVFRRALSIIRPGESLDSTLGKILGFTPTLLTLTLLRTQEASPLILKTLGDTWVDSSLTEADMTLVERLVSLCRLSETLARATARGSNFASEPHWELSRADFESRVGRNGWLILETELQWCLSSYAQYSVPGVISPRIVRALSENVARETAAQTAQLESLAPVRRIRPEDRRILLDFFLRAIAPGGIEIAFQYLAQHALRGWGFGRGIVLGRTSSEQQFTSHWFSPGWNAENPEVPSQVIDRIRGAALLEGVLQGDESSENMSWAAALVGPAACGLIYMEFPASTESAQRSTLIQIIEALRTATSLL